MHQRADSETLTEAVSPRIDWRALLKIGNDEANVDGGTVDVDEIYTMTYWVCVHANGQETDGLNRHRS